MKIVESWIIDYLMVVKLEDGSYRYGTEANIFGFNRLDKNVAEKMIATGKREEGIY